MERSHRDRRPSWYNEKTGQVFCLIEAPNMEAAIAMHWEAHGMVADEIHEVKEGENGRE